MEYVHKKFPDGKFYQVSSDEPTIRLCMGMAGTCRISMADEWHHPLCPACRFQVNAGKVLAQAKSLGLI